MTLSVTGEPRTSTSNLLNASSIKPSPTDSMQVSDSTSSDQSPTPTAREWHIYRQGLNAGYRSGYKHGFEDAVRECDEADREVQDAFTRQAARSAQQAIDVYEARQKLKTGEQ